MVPLANLAAQEWRYATLVAMIGPMASYCARCKRRNVVSCNVPEEIKRLVLLGRWKTGMCPSCFDELAEQGGIRYSFEDASAVSWSDMPAPKTRPRKKR